MLQLGKDLLRFRSVLTSAAQVGKVEVRGWDVATKTALTATEDATTKRIELPTVTPQKLAQAFGNPTYVATDIPTGSQAEVDAGGEGAGRRTGQFVRGVRGHRAREPETAGRGVGEHRRAGGAVRREVHITTSRHRFDPITGYSTSFSVTGRRDRTMLGWPRAADAGRRRPAS